MYFLLAVHITVVDDVDSVFLTFFSLNLFSTYDPALTAITHKLVFDLSTKRIITTVNDL